MYYSQVKTAARKQQMDTMLQKFLEFVHHYEQENNQELSKFEDFFVGNEPELELVQRCGDFGMMVHISNVDPYHDEGGPAELIGFFPIDYNTNQVDYENLDLLLMNFDTYTEAIWKQLPYPHNRHGFKWEVEV